MPTYRVRIKNGVRHGVAQHESGEVITVSEAEVQSFGDKFEVLEEIPDEEQVTEEEVEEVADETANEMETQIEAVINRLTDRFGPSIVEEKVEPQELADLQARMSQGDVPPLEDVVGPHLAGKLDEAGFGDPITVFYAEDGDLTSIDGIGIGTLRKLRDVYGKP